MNWNWLLLVLAVLAVAGVYLSWTAGRIDRLHARLDAARAVLEAQLFRRAAIALEVATSGMLDPATSLLVIDAAQRSSAADDEEEREVAGSDLSKALAVVFPDVETSQEIATEPGAAELLAELGAACRRVEMARRFHNDTVATTRALRGRRLVRWFRLAGHARMPTTVEMDVTPPAGLAP
ncbi:hypothetical protein ACWDWO_01625 [Actinopolymorpha singaporensis]|uniref:Uncharacterized conserved protein n=1 Tax=Actinopolymorpha singaporensis TaxID=117157 RepID=A0A1H1VHZ1_9ACTN|nr:hypothetical protein [Actinopolymorpha singaporensis]SDS83709.1 Uncharacterized conserved protein [Actinopolymorpha singaporensis]